MISQNPKSDKCREILTSGSAETQQLLTSFLRANQAQSSLSNSKHSSKAGKSSELSSSGERLTLAHL